VKIDAGEFIPLSHSIKPNPDRLRDWISTPKADDSHHSDGPEGKWVEVKIRSERMDEVA